MPRFRVAPLVLASALALAATPAPAQEEGPVWVSSLKKAFEISRQRGAPVLVWCVGDVDTSEKADLEVLKNKEVLKAMKGFLVVLANPSDAHGSQDGLLDGRKVKVCKLAPGIVCSDHMRAWNEVYGSFADVMADKAGMIKVPNHFVVDGEGKVLGTINNGNIASGFDAVPPPQMVKGLQTLLAKAGGPGITDEQYDRFQKALASARSSVEQGRMSEAARTLKPLIDTGKKIAIINDARDLLKRADKEATAAMARAQALLKENPLAGLVALDRVPEDFPGTESAALARKAADEFRASPEGKKAMKDMGREKEGRAELEKAVEVADSRKDDPKALRMLDAVARKYGGLPCGDEAKSRAEAIRGDADRMKAIQAADSEREARAELVTARGLLDAGRKDEARKALQAIVDAHPGTRGAEEAKKLLEGLR